MPAAFTRALASCDGGGREERDVGRRSAAAGIDENLRRSSRSTPRAHLRDRRGVHLRLGRLGNDHCGGRHVVREPAAAARAEGSGRDSGPCEAHIPWNFFLGPNGRSVVGRRMKSHCSPAVERSYLVVLPVRKHQLACLTDTRHARGFAPPASKCTPPRPSRVWVLPMMLPPPRAMTRRTAGRVRT